MTDEEDPLSRQKDAAEPRWRSALVAFWRGQLERVKKKLAPGIPKGRKAIADLPKRLDKAFWDNENDELLALLLPLISEAAQEAGKEAVDYIIDMWGIAIDWGLVNADAVAWARKYTGKLVKDLNDTTRKQLRQHVAQWIETPGATMGDLYRDLEMLPGFSEYRAKLVATTEVTRAYAQGSLIGAKAYETEGLFEWRKKWQTYNDDIVCPFCKELHHQTTMGVDGDVWTEVGLSVSSPPLHPGCRCWTTLRPVLGD